MNDLKIGDVVARKSYGADIYFKIVDIKQVNGEQVITLKGISYRIEADAPESDLVRVNDQKVIEYNSRMNSVISRKCREISMSRSRRSFPKKAYYRSTPSENTRKFSKSGKVLHVDGDKDYLDTCLTQYRKFDIDVVGEFVAESEQPLKVYGLLQQHRPDILVLTGHDGLIKGDKNYSSLDNYRNSKYFIESVKEARRFEPDLDSLVIFAGACQSMFKGIINAGANFASAPYRVLIHALDPVFICEKIALTGIDKIISPSDVINNTITGVEGIGGIETRGKYRSGYPSEPYNS